MTSDKKPTNHQDSNIRPQEVDGIQECDNPLPDWWVGLFVFTILFGAVYLFYFHILGGADHLEHYNMVMNNRESQTEVVTGNLDERLDSAEMAQAATEAFEANCVVCHGAKGEGGIGPNLTDSYWIHGGSAAEILTVIEVGVLEKGMPPWRDILGRQKSEELTALILSWRGNPQEGKEPEGELYEGD